MEIFVMRFSSPRPYTKTFIHSLDPASKIEVQRLAKIRRLQTAAFRASLACSMAGLVWLGANDGQLTPLGLAALIFSLIALLASSHFLVNTPHLQPLSVVERARLDALSAAHAPIRSMLREIALQGRPIVGNDLFEAERFKLRLQEVYGFISWREEKVGREAAMRPMKTDEIESHRSYGKRMRMLFCGAGCALFVIGIFMPSREQTFAVMLMAFLLFGFGALINSKLQVWAPLNGDEREELNHLAASHSTVQALVNEVGGMRRVAHYCDLQTARALANQLEETRKPPNP